MFKKVLVVIVAVMFFCNTNCLAEEPEFSCSKFRNWHWHRMHNLFDRNWYGRNLSESL